MIRLKGKLWEIIQIMPPENWCECWVDENGEVAYDNLAAWALIKAVAIEHPETGIIESITFITDHETRVVGMSRTREGFMECSETMTAFVGYHHEELGADPEDLYEEEAKEYRKKHGLPEPEEKDDEPEESA